MSIASEITRINTNIANAYTKVSEKGGTLPETQNSANLADAIDTITGGSPALPYTELEYIESTGTQSIDTGIVGNQDTGFEADFIMTGPIEQSRYAGYVVGARQTWENSRFQLSGWKTYNGGQFGYGNNYNYDPGIVQNQRCQVSVKNKVLTNASGQTYSLANITFSTSANLYLFVCKEPNGFAEYGKLKLYSFKLYDNNTLVRDYIPVKDENDVVCLYDKVSETYFYNQGTGVFGAGPERSRLQTKSVSVTQNGTQTITADSGYDGLAQVDLNVIVESADRNAKIKSVITDIDLRKSIITFNLIDTSNITNMNGMFYYYTSLTAIPLIDTSNVTDMGAMFYGCSSLETIPLLNTTSATNMNGMFKNCSSLITIPLINTSNVTNMNEMFANCPLLTSIPQLNTSNVTNMAGVFYKCSSLTTIPLLDTSKVTTMQNTFTQCYNFTNETLNNILGMCANATNYSATKTLSYIGLSGYSGLDQLSNYQAFIAAGWTTG